MQNSLSSSARSSAAQPSSTASPVPAAGTPAVRDTYSQDPVPASRGARTDQPSCSATFSRQSSHHRTPTVTARDNTAQPSDTPLLARIEDKDMEDSPAYLSLSYGDTNVVEDSHRILGALRTIVGYVNSSNIDLHSSPMGASLAQALVDFTRKTFNGDLGTTPTPDNILPIRAVAEIFAAEDDTIQRPLAIGPTSPDPLCISSPPAWSDHSGAGNDDVVMIPAEPVCSSHRSAQARPPIRAQQDKGKGRADKPPPPPPAPPQPHPPAKKPVVPNQRHPPVPPSSTHPMRPAPRSYAEAARKKAPARQPASLAAPPSRPTSRKGRRIPDYTSHGSSRRQLLINVGDHTKDANLTTLFKDLSSDVLFYQGLCVKVLGVEIAYDGYAVPTDKVPSERDTDILCSAVTTHFKAHYKFMPWVGMPTSKLFLRIVDVPQFQGTHYDLDHLTKREEVASALKASPIWSSSHILCGDPRVVCTSKASTTATAFFDIWDTASIGRALASPSALGVGSGAIQSVAAMQLPPNVHDALVLTSWRSIAPLQAAAKAIQRRTPPRHQCLVGSPALTPLAAQIAERIMVPMSTLACSGVTGSISFGMSRNIVRMSQTVQDLPVRILSFNCAKSSLSVETILEHFVLAYDIVFIQEPPWRFVRTAPSTSLIDLVFVQPDQILTAQVTRVHNAMGESDHILLATTLSISADSGAMPRRALKADKEE
ncbi:hypothetical protein CVT25_011506 [Psilocybe cyanescens]|uniref:Endonuclease/exonuclease/phosphatase domain-containing protein n=1 Tax=Psilocybe cyanescens TaxID=93625 RepID=A0A409XV37_PSICY|nr:hypothetical protein CVT25_011506 [Psilocybe cyanescens]